MSSVIVTQASIKNDIEDCINGSSAKTLPVGADSVALIDSEASNVLKEVTLSDLLYQPTVLGPGAASVTDEGGNSVTIGDAEGNATDKVSYCKVTSNDSAQEGGLWWEVPVPEKATGLTSVELVYKNDGSGTGVHLEVIDSDGNIDDESSGSKGTSATKATHTLTTSTGTYTKGTIIVVKALFTGDATEYGHLSYIKCNWAS